MLRNSIEGDTCAMSISLASTSCSGGGGQQDIGDPLAVQAEHALFEQQGTAGAGLRVMRSLRSLPMKFKHLILIKLRGHGA